MASTDGVESSREILLAGISHDMNRNITSLSAEIEAWISRYKDEDIPIPRGRLSQLKRIATHSDSLAAHLKTLIDRADDREFSTIRELLRALDVQITRPLHAISKTLSEISKTIRAKRGATVSLQTLASRYARAADQLEALSNFASLDTTPNYQIVNLSKEIFKATHDLSGLLFREAISISSIRQRGSATILTDRGLVSAVVTNLITNAVMHRDRRRRPFIDLYISAASLDEVISLPFSDECTAQGPSDWACIDVSDNGPGIRSDEQDKIFQLFKQGTKAAKEGTGSGVGLAVVGYSLGILGGCVQLFSEVGEGSTFRVFLPNGRVDGTVPVKVNRDDP